MGKKHFDLKRIKKHEKSHLDLSKHPKAVGFSVKKIPLLKKHQPNKSLDTVHEKYNDIYENFDSPESIIKNEFGEKALEEKAPKKGFLGIFKKQEAKSYEQEHIEAESIEQELGALSESHEPLDSTRGKLEKNKQFEQPQENVFKENKDGSKGLGALDLELDKIEQIEPEIAEKEVREELLELEKLEKINENLAKDTKNNGIVEESDVLPPIKKTPKKYFLFKKNVRSSLKTSQVSHFRLINKKSFWFGVAIVTFFIIFVTSGIKTHYFIVSSADTAKQDLSFAKMYAEKGDYANALTSFEKSSQVIDKANKNFGVFRYVVDAIGLVYPKAQSNMALFDSLVALSNAQKTSKETYESLLNSENLKNIQNGNVAEIIKLADSKKNSLKKIEADLNQASESLAKVNSAFYSKEEQETLNGAKKNLTKINEYLAVVNEILDNKDKYLNSSVLVLLPNNNEIQLSGGFTGSFGVLDFKPDGKNQFTVFDVYAFDNAYQANTGKDDMFLRNATKVSPDFSITAKEAITRFNAEAPYVENQKTREFLAVLALTPSVLETIVSVTGAVDLPEYGLVLDKTNVVIELEKQVENGADKKAGANPKGILNVFGEKLGSKVLALPLEKKLELSKNILNDIYTKQITASFTNQNQEKLATDQDINAKIKQAAQDYLMVANENIGGGKSSLAVKNSYKYELSENGDDLIATLTITRKHESDYVYRYFDVKQKLSMWLIGVNVNKTNVYVPEGAEVLENAGLIGFEKTNKDSKTVFSFWTTVAPLEQKSFTIKYRIPKKQVSKYELLVQKQPGSVKDEFSFRYFLDERKVSKTNIVDYNEEKTVDFLTDLDSDKTLQIEFVK